MRLNKTILRTGREDPNSNGYFVQNRNGATVAGPFATIQEAWKEEKRREADDRAVMNRTPYRPDVA